jgi:peroxiredoxin/mono/diheme cytochrome c family protein
MSFRSRILAARPGALSLVALVVAGGVGIAQAAEPPPKAPRKPQENPLDRFEAFDKNQDGKVTAEEFNNPFMFVVLDRNHDGFILRPEAAEALAEMETRKRWAKLTNAPSGEVTTSSVATTSTSIPAPLTEALQTLPGAPLGVGKRLADLSVRTLDGKQRALAPGAKSRALVVAVTSSSCPLSGKYAPVLARLEAAYREKGVEFAFVAPVSTDSPASLREMVRQQGWRGPVVADPKGEVSAVLGVRSTTEVFVYDAARTLVYRGGIDDQYGLGYSRAKPQTEPLKAALDAVLADRRPDVVATSAPGCVVELPKSAKASSAKTAPVTYHRQISRLIQQHCQECHHTGGLGPFSLEKYEDVVSHAGMIRKQVERGVMPPWFAAPAHDQSWANDRSIPEADRQELLTWLAGDRPVGDPKETPLPRAFHPEWNIGKPDVVFQAPKAIAIPAEGVMEYQNVLVDTGIAEDRWVTGMEIQPSAPAVVHHVLVFVHAKGERKGRRDDSGDERAGFFAAYVPGNSFQTFPPGFAKLLRGNSSLRFQIHYTPNGKATQDQIRIGLRFQEAAPRYAVHVLGLANPLIRIPAGANHHAEHAGSVVPQDARILTFMPHMHVRGAAFRYELEEAGGKVRTLLDIPRYDFNWQLSYRPAEPVLAPAGSRIRATGWFDNSTGNPANPDPSKVVKWGNQTFDEMMLGYIEYYYPTELL